MGGMPGGIGMPMNMGQMGGGMQGMINPNHHQIMHSGQNTAHNGKVHTATANVGQNSARSNTPLHSQYQSSIGVPGSSPLPGNPHSNRDSYMVYHEMPPTKTQSNQAGGGFQPHFNPAFFPQNQAAGGDWQNPHGAKRPRPE